jgi:hypothetical protein
LHKREIDEKDEDNDEEVISIAYFLEVINLLLFRRIIENILKNLLQFLFEDFSFSVVRFSGGVLFYVS